jgi:hypothetical protein
MSTQFTYRILTYTHSQIMNEKVNVGILFYSHHEKNIIFKHPKNFKRIRTLYNDFQEWQLNSTLLAIEDKIGIINRRLAEKSLFNDVRLEEEIINDVLRRDATVLSFSEPKNLFLDEDDFNLKLENFYKLIFSYYYNDIDVKRERHDEKYLIRNFKSILLSKNNNIETMLKRDVEISSENTTLKFDYQWKNGVINLVKPIGFDLEDDNAINHKAILLYGQLDFISEQIHTNNYNIDLLISAPTSREKNLQKAYEKAITILQKSGIKKNIFEEKDIEKYTDTVVKGIRPLV